MLQATQAIENADAPIGIDHYPRDCQTFPIKSLSFLFDKEDLQHPLIVTSVEDIGVQCPPGSMWPSNCNKPPGLTVVEFTAGL